MRAVSVGLRQVSHRLAAMALLSCGVAQAAVFRDVHYADADAAGTPSLDVHQPERPGPHPVLVHLAGVGLEDLAPRLVARGYLVAEVRVRGTGPASAIALEDARAALRWLRGHVSAYDGDRDRIALLAIGDAATLAARLAASGAAEGGDAPLGIVLWQPGDPALDAIETGSAARTPMLIVAAEAPALARAAEGYAERMRKRGAAVDWLAPLGANAGAGALVDTVAAWLMARKVPRVARVESLAFAHDREFESVVAPDGAALAALVVHGRRLFATRLRSARVWTRAGPAEPWRVDADFAPRFARVVWLAEAGAANGDRATPPLAALLERDGAIALALRDDASGRWSPPIEVAAAADAAPRVHAVAHEDAVTHARELLVGVEHERGGVRALHGLGARSRPTLGPLEPGVDGRVTALAVVDGVAHAAVAPSDSTAGGLYRRVDGRAPRWEHVTALPARDGAVRGALRALSAVPDPRGAGHQVLVGMLDGGLIVRLDPARGYAASVELDAAAALAAEWGRLGAGDGPLRATTAGLLPIRHPESNELVHALGLSAVHPTQPGAYYLVRQLDASYSVALARDFDAAAAAGPMPTEVRALVVSPFAADGGRVLYLGGRGLGGAWLARARWPDDAIHRGLWWDRRANGIGLELRRAGARWIALLYSYDDRGDPTWHFALGDLVDGRFVADEAGLARYTRVEERSPPQQRDAEGSGSIVVEFASGAGDPACAGDRSDALALAAVTVVLRGRTQRWCLEPFVQHVGTPGTGMSGLWYGGEDDQGWGLGVEAQGYDGATRVVATLFYHDGAGEPRWALAVGDSSGGEADLDLLSFRAPCAGCPAATMEAETIGTLVLRMAGYCGEARGTARIDAAYRGGEGGRFRRIDVALHPLSTAACY